MRAKAIVIGIDRYPVPEWCLGGAVRDALAFAGWLLDSGQVAREDISLMLAPLPGDEVVPAALAPLNQEPTKAAIADVLYAFKSEKKKAGEGFDRLWFFYAGHGLSAPGESPEDGPLLVPCDVDDVDRYLDYGRIGIDEFRTAMQDLPPKEQVYFVDACRDVLPTSGSKVMTTSYFWNVSKVTNDKLAMQAVLFATTAGQRAKEIRGRGVFSSALLSGLKGLGPDLDPPLQHVPGRTPLERLVFDKLVKFVEFAVKQELQEGDSQVPYGMLSKVGDFTLAEFASGQLPAATLTFAVDPPSAWPTGQIVFMQYSGDEGAYVPRRRNPEPARPLKKDVVMRVRGGQHYVQVSAEAFNEEGIPLRVWQDKTIPVELKPKARDSEGLLHAPKMEALRGFGLEAVRSGVGGLTATERTPSAQPGQLSISAKDALTRLSLFSPDGRLLTRGYQEIYVNDLVPGPYRATAELAGRDRTERQVIVRSGANQVQLDVAVATPSEPVLNALARLDIKYVDGVLQFPARFGNVAGARLSALLAYAAWAARWPDRETFDSLHQLNIDRLPGLGREQCGLQVIVADTDGEAPVLVEVAGPPSTAGSQLAPTWVLSPLPLLPIARQAALAVSPGTHFVSVQMAGFSPVTVAVSALPGFVAVLIVSRELGADVEIQQYLNPIDTTTPVGQGFPVPECDDVRLVELAWRALAERDSLDKLEYRGLLHGKRSNPLLGAIAGYRLWGSERSAEFTGPADAPRHVQHAGASPLWNMVNLFPALPDVHVLAALYDSPNRDEHFTRAAELGTPVIAQGFMALAEWTAQRAAAAGVATPELRRSLLPGTPWSAWSEPPDEGTGRRAPEREALRMVTSKGRVYRESASPAGLREAASRVGWLLSPLIHASCFLLNGRQIVCPRAVVDLFSEQNHTMAYVRFDGANGHAYALTPGFSTLPGTYEDTPGSEWPCIVDIKPVANTLGDRGRLVFSEVPPALGEGLALIAFPTLEVPSNAFAPHFGARDGVRHIMLGSVRDVTSGGLFEYDCLALEGCGGGLVVDADSGVVLGIHIGVRPHESRRGFGLAITRVPELSRLSSV